MLDTIKIGTTNLHLVYAPTLTGLFIPNGTTLEKTVEVKSTHPFIILNAYLWHDLYRLANLSMLIRNFMCDNIQITNPPTQYLISSPFTWIRAGLPQCWEKGFMATRLFSMVMQWNNATGGDITINFYDILFMIQATTSQQFSITWP